MTKQIFYIVALSFIAFNAFAQKRSNVYLKKVKTSKKIEIYAINPTNRDIQISYKYKGWKLVNREKCVKKTYIKTVIIPSNGKYYLADLKEECKVPWDFLKKSRRSKLRILN